MKFINRLTGNNTIESSIVIILLMIAVLGILFNFVFFAAAYKQQLIIALDNNNELLLYTGYLSLYLSTLIDSDRHKNKMLVMVFGIASLTISFVATSIIHSFTLKNVYLLTFIILVTYITFKKNFVPEHTIESVLYILYLVSFILIAIDIFSPHKIIMDWLFL